MKRSGAGPLDSIQREIFLTDADPQNPDNNAYIPVINSSTYPSVVAAGKRSPRISLHTCLKPRNTTHGWSNADIFNSLVGVDTTNNTDDFAVGFIDEWSTRIYDHCRCDRLDFAGHAQGGPQSVMMGFLTRWGEQDGPYGTTGADGEIYGIAPAFNFVAVAPDAGQATPSAEVTFVGLTQVQTYQLSLIRGQAPRYYFGSNNGPAAIVSTMFSGLLTVEQEVDATTQIIDTGSVVITFNSAATLATGRFKITMLVKRDNRYQAVVTRIGTVVNTYSLIDLVSGGNPALIVGI